MSIRALELLFFLYFASHIPITLFIDLQALLPEHVYPQQVGGCGGASLQAGRGPADSRTVSVCVLAAERPAQMVRRRVQGPHDAGSSRVVQVFRFL